MAPIGSQRPREGLVFATWQDRPIHEADTGPQRPREGLVFATSRAWTRVAQQESRNAHATTVP